MLMKVLLSATQEQKKATRILHQCFAESPKDFSTLLEGMGFKVLESVETRGNRRAAMFVAEQNQRNLR